MNELISSLLSSIVLSAFLCSVLYIAPFVRWRIANYSDAWFLCVLVSLTPFVPTSWLISAEILPPDVTAWQMGGGSSLGILTSGESHKAIYAKYSDLLSAILYVSILSSFAGGAIRFFIADSKIKRFISDSSGDLDDSLLSRQQLETVQRLSINFKLAPVDVPPFVYGWRNATIVLPAFFLDLKQGHRNILIDHELTHVSRRDHNFLWWITLLASVFWVNPFLPVFRKKFIAMMELNCDSDVLNSRCVNKKGYAEALLQCLKRSNTSLNLSLAAEFGHFTKTTSRSKSMQFNRERITKIIQSARPVGKPRIKAFAFGTGILAVCANLAIAAGSAKNSVSDNWVLPLDEYRVSSRFGVKQSIRANNPHNGIDLAAKIGRDIKSVNSGVVMIAGDRTLNKNYGTVVVIDHGEGLSSLYAHMEKTSVSVGDRVNAGQVIGTVGVSGKSTGPHLHLELRNGDSPVDPALYLNF